MMAIKILVVEDEPAMNETLDYSLKLEGYDVRTAFDGVEALKVFREFKPDAVLLDLMLPRLTGEEVCRALRKTSDTPIIILSAKGEVVDKVVLLEIGADDFISKPFNLREMMARLKAVLRRTSAKEDNVLESRGLKLDRERHSVIVDGSRLELPLKEYQLLEKLMAGKGRVIERQEIVRDIWGEEFFGDGKTVDVHIRRLRKKIEEEPEEPRRIRTVRGIGYIFDDFE